MAAVVGEEQLVYGSDRPVADPIDLARDAGLDPDAIEEATDRALRAGPRELVGVA